MSTNLTKITSYVIALLVATLPTSAWAQTRENARQDFHGIWVSTVSNIDYPSKRGLDSHTLAKEADDFLDMAQELGFNAIFLQVRPMCDALYRSEIFPWSSFVSGTQGKAPDGDFDPLAYWIEGAHRRNIQIHAWLNPYRVATSKKMMESLADNNPAKLHPEWLFEHKDRTYLDPGVPEARRLVVDGIVEIVKNYDVDGIHIDDYFYPERKIEADAQTYEKYGKEFDNIEDWRRNNVDLFIKAASDAIHKEKPNVVWSVSPAGIWANKASNPLGSETRGNECYYNLFADVRGWVKKEWIDAVIPQIYWEIGFKIADFKILTDWWSDAVDGTNVKLYVGMAAYRVNPDSKTEAWRTSEELTRQLEYMATKPEVSGQVFFTANNFKKGKPAREAVEKYGKEHGWK